MFFFILKNTEVNDITFYSRDFSWCPRRNIPLHSQLSPRWRKVLLSLPSRSAHSPSSLPSPLLPLLFSSPSLLAPPPLSSLSLLISSSLTPIFPHFLSLCLGGTFYLVGCHSGSTTAAKSIQVVCSDPDPRVPSSQAVPGMNSEVQENKIRFLMRGPVVEFLQTPTPHLVKGKRERWRGRA